MARRESKMPPKLGSTPKAQAPADTEKKKPKPKITVIWSRTRSELDPRSLLTESQI